MSDQPKLLLDDEATKVNTIFINLSILAPLGAHLVKAKSYVH